MVEQLYFKHYSARNAKHFRNARITPHGTGDPKSREELPKGFFLATSDELPGLVAQGRTVAEALEIARDVARRLIEARSERGGIPVLPTITELRDFTIVSGLNFRMSRVSTIS